MDCPAPGQRGLALAYKKKRTAKKGLQPSESQIEIAICHFLRVHHFFFWKQPSRGYFDTKLKRFRKDHNPYVGVGVPDLIIIYLGFFIGLEVKSEKGIQSENQIQFEHRCLKAGGFYFVVRSVEETQRALDHACAIIHEIRSHEEL